MAKKNSHTGLILAVSAVAALGLYSAYRRTGKPSLFVRDWLPFGRAALTVPPWGVMVRADNACNVRLLDGQLKNWQIFQQAGLLGYYVEWFKGGVQSGYDVSNINDVQYSATENYYRGGGHTEYQLQESYVSDIDSE